MISRIHAKKLNRIFELKSCMYLIILAMGCVLFWIGALSEISLAQEVTYEAELEIPSGFSISPEGDFVAVSLTPQIYQHAKGDLSDVRVLNSKGEAVPYTFLRQDSSFIETKENRYLTEVEARREKERDVYDFKTESSIAQDILIDGLDIWVDQSGDYLFEVIIWGSYDGLTFDEITRGTVYKVKEHRSDVLEFNQSQKYTTYRVQTNQTTNSLVPLNVSGRKRTRLLKTDTFSGSKEVSFLTPFSQVETGTISVLTLDKLTNLPITSLTLETQSLYRRFITITAKNLVGDEQLYTGEGARFYLDNGQLAMPSINIRRARDFYQTLEIKIENKDDAPLKLDGIRVNYFPDQLVFNVLPEETYRIAYGDPSLRAPEYDLSRVVGNLHELIAGEMTIGSINQVVVPAVSDNEVGTKLVFNLAIIFAGILLAFVSLRALRGRHSSSK